MIDLTNGLSVEDLLTLFGLGVVTAIIVELWKRTFALTEATVSRFGPALAIVSGMTLGILASVFLGREPVQGALTGFLAGALAGGLYDLAGAQIGALWAKLPKPGA
ncbi:MAG: hypothetical protein AB1627_00970 [Chloroflexota bacterium]